MGSRASSQGSNRSDKEVLNKNEINLENVNRKMSRVIDEADNEETNPNDEEAKLKANSHRNNEEGKAISNQVTE